jgi:hypothetical protein
MEKIEEIKEIKEKAGYYHQIITRFLVFGVVF